jgi:transcriptional regulator with XRE-family HTH domain
MNNFMPDQTAEEGVSEISLSGTENSGQNIDQAKETLRKTENHDDTIRHLLANYDLGSKLRQLRLRKKIALVDLGKHTGLSASMLSQLENGKLVPTLPTLARIAMVFDVGLEHFFSDQRARRVFSIVRAGERLRFPDLADSPTPGYFFEVLIFGATDKPISAYLAEFPTHEAKDTRSHFHSGAEFIYVLSGQLAINYLMEDHLLGPGDSVYFDASEPHSYTGKSEQGTTAIVVTSQPRL